VKKMATRVTYAFRVEERRDALIKAGRGKLPVVVASDFAYTGIGPGHNYDPFEFIDPSGDIRAITIPTYSGEHGDDNKECFLFVLQPFYAAMMEALIERIKELSVQLTYVLRGVPKNKWDSFRQEHVSGEIKEDFEGMVNNFILVLHAKDRKKLLWHLEN
jgi:hypothetical protein